MSDNVPSDPPNGAPQKVPPEQPSRQLQRQERRELEHQAARFRKRLQLPEAYIDALDMEDRVRLRLNEDHIGVWPEQADDDNGDNGQEVEA